MLKILHVVGARPNLPKLAPVHRAARGAGLDQVIVHTGQHYDDALSGAFFRELAIPKPDIDLGVGSDTHGVQTARVMERLEPILRTQKPDWVVVYGDVNSTMAAAIVASKLGIRVAHVEAGLRSNDRTMPEEINRIVTDRLADLLLTPSRDADATLRAEGEPDEEIVFVGNVMIDTLLHALPAAQATGFHSRFGARARPVIVTLHRPSNVDDPARLAALARTLREIAERHPVIFPVHPRTRQRLAAAALDLGKVELLEPIGYLEMLDLVQSARVVITDSGGLQEETTALGVPCLTVRENTERPITISEGTNQLVPNPGELQRLVDEAMRPASHRCPEGWDGRAGERITRALVERAGGARPRGRDSVVRSVARAAASPRVTVAAPSNGGALSPSDAIQHLFTVDVEEHFQVSAFDGAVSRADWPAFPSRIARNVDLLLELLARHGTSATFFVLGWIAERHAAVVQSIAAAGHEIASHGWWHRRVGGLTPGEFRADVRSSKAVLEDLCGRPVLGFRAPSFSIVPGTEWAFDVLLEEGYRYDSSLFPIRRSGYGYPRASCKPHRIRRPAGKLLELPPATVSWGRLRLPAGGGGYFRHFPYALTQEAFRQHTMRRVSGTFYIHPWEIDEDQPRISVPWLTRVRHYRKLNATLPRLERLLTEFRFTSIARGMRIDAGIASRSSASLLSASGPPMLST
jgi:UDP-N-acetylglucosamine 2-epimerase (non-hydrolysing)